MELETAPGAEDYEDEVPFLEATPPHWAARGLAYVMILLFLAVVVVSIFLHIPETVSSPFTLAPVRGTDAVRTPRSGVVVEAPVSEGGSVTKGMSIFVIRSRDVGDRFSELETLENRVRNNAESLANARRKYESGRRADEEEARRLEATRAHLARMLLLRREQVSVAREQLERSKKLADQGLTSWVEYTDYKLKASQSALELQQLETEERDNLAAIEKLRHDADARETELRELERSIRETAATSGFRARALSGDLAGSAGNDFAIRAPCSGTVLRLEARRPGAVVGEGDVVCEIACSGERLQAELTVPQAGLAQVRPGQPVKLLYDAFPYQRYGVQRGNVRWTSPASVTVNDAPSFRVFVDLQDQAVRVNGQPMPLMAGMGGTARVVVGSRSLISYAFGPLRQLRENMAAAPRQKNGG